MLKKLFNSTRAFYDRFNVYPPSRVSARKVFNEECRELVDAGRVIDGILALPAEERRVDDLAKPREHLALEAADVIVTALGMCMAYGIGWRDLHRAVKAVRLKNDGKTHESHTINKAGKIARKVTTPVDTSDQGE